ncbi:MAG: DUF3037 domain-containing protein [Chitinophagaceae bacterium]
MQEKFLFEYAILRVVPRVEREEFLNVGVILFCKKQKFLETRFHLDEARLTCFCAKINVAEIMENLRSFERIGKGEEEGGSIGKLDVASRFRWLTATRSTVVQTSKVHPGFSTDLSKALTKLYEQFVL